MRKEECVFSKREVCKESLMVWACFSYFGKSDFAFFSGHVGAKKYIDTLEMNLFLLAAFIHGESWTFQHRNASVPTASKVTQYFRGKM